MRAGVGAPPVLGAGGRAWVRVVWVVPARYLCSGGCVAVRCLPWYRGAWCCLPSPVSLLPPSLAGVVVLCLTWRLAAPPSPRASLARLLATLLLPLFLRRSLPFPLLSVGPPPSLREFSSTSALVLVMVFPLAYFRGPGVLHFLSFLVL